MQVGFVQDVCLCVTVMKDVWSDMLTEKGVMGDKENTTGSLSYLSFACQSHCVISTCLRY